VHDDGRLAVLTSGARPVNPSEALASMAMKHLLRQLADEYDYVFLDTPPVLPVSDPLVLAPLVDGVILVVQLGRTTRDRVERATKALNRVNATILGAVPNKSREGRDRDYRYPYYYADTRNRYKRGRRTDADVLVPVNNGHWGEADPEDPATRRPAGWPTAWRPDGGKPSRPES
jgi:Mrp family chromosome partitioning ATPase